MPKQPKLISLVGLVRIIYDETKAELKATNPHRLTELPELVNVGLGASLWRGYAQGCPDTRATRN